MIEEKEKKESSKEEMPLTAHLEELRRRIIISVIAIGAGFIVSYNFTEKVLSFIRRPIKAGNLVFLHPTEALWTHMKLALVMGIVLAFPVVAHQVWKFIEPGLLRKEKTFALPFIVFSSLLFAVGGAFALLVVLPFAVGFLVSYRTENLTPMISVGNYVDFYLKFFLAFGLIFEMPLAITLLAKMGLVTHQFLARNRKYAILVNFIIAAILTPTPDIFNQALMAAPLIVLYEVSIHLAKFFEKKQPLMGEENSVELP